MTTKPKNILISGGCGFIGHHFVEHIHKTTDYNIIIIDKLTYASKGLTRLRELNLADDPRVKFYCYDLSNPMSHGLKSEIGKDIDIIVHMAAESHVDSSISNPELFVKNNIFSTLYLLEYARELPNLKSFVYFSTDEVYGHAPAGTAYKEWDRHHPTNPYSASKSGAESLSISYHNTYNVPLIIVNVMNAMGERQHVEKFIPKTILNLLNDETILIYADDEGTPGSRHYIHCRNIADATLFLINNGEIGEKYNISGETEVSNLEMAQLVAKALDLPLKYKIVNANSERPGNDHRYALDGTKLFNMGWRPPVSFQDSLTKTVQWTIEPNNIHWLHE